MPYDRAKAVQHAHDHWNSPCNDGIFWLSNDSVNVEAKRKELHAPAKDSWVLRFVPDGKGGEEAVFLRPKHPGGVPIPKLAGTWERKLIQPWEGLADCAHYLSECLRAGGLTTVNERGVKSLVNTLRARSDTKTLADVVPQDNAQHVIDSGIFKPGDMIGYFNISATGDYGGKQDYTHSTMYVGKDPAKNKGRVTCHTKSRFMDLYNDDEWFLASGDYKYTLIHISADDTPPTKATQDRIEGWWTVEYAGQKEFYRFTRQGTVKFTMHQPKTNTSTVQTEISSGYWFESGSRVIVFWQKWGVVDLFDLSRVGTKVPFSEDGVTGSATRLF
ncbi:MAG: hypothetical protein ABI353_10145 [Isosphaeraceae bacterium]